MRRIFQVLSVWYIWQLLFFKGLITCQHHELCQVDDIAVGSAARLMTPLALISLFHYLSIHPSSYLHTYLIIYLSIHPSVYLPTYLSMALQPFVGT
jgi:hypothetical protein